MLPRMTDRYDQLAKLNRLRADGALTEFEYDSEKAKLLAGDERPSPASPGTDAYKPWGMEPKVFGMVMHLSQFASFIIPLSGLVLPIVMWATEKENSKEVDIHGRIIINFMISFIIYTIISLFLCLIVIGFAFLIALLIMSIVFTILGAVKANEGKIWVYPLSIRFLTVPALDEDAAPGDDRSEPLRDA